MGPKIELPPIIPSSDICSQKTPKSTMCPKPTPLVSHVSSHHLSAILLNVTLTQPPLSTFFGQPPPPYCSYYSPLAPQNLITFRFISNPENDIVSCWVVQCISTKCVVLVHNQQCYVRLVSFEWMTNVPITKSV